MKLRAILLAAVIAGPFFYLFGPALTGARTFVFRDSAHYYYPLFAWTAGEWRQGRPPLWNPHENGGSAVLADATSSVFYPGKLLFALPASYTLRYNLYVTLHVLLAALGAFRAARQFGASPQAAALAALSYAYGGSVVFQYCNVVYLVGAAWLPLALVTADRLLTQRKAAAVPSFAAVLALMTLGGDPQTAYHAGLLALLYAWMLRGARPTECPGPAHGAKSSEQNASVPLPQPRTSGWRQTLHSHRLLLLVAAGACGLLLAAVQVIPAAARLHASRRAAFDSPRSVYEIPEFLLRPAADVGEAEGEPPPSIAAGLLAAPRDETHHQHAYHFSVGPWRLAELCWPNVSGQLFPVNRRWTSAIPAEGRVWTPSLYMGLLPLVLALGAARPRGGEARTRWLTWSMLLAVQGSFGWYGLGWLLHEAQFALSADADNPPWLAQPVGGVYWLMVVLLPGYAGFRFPAKLFVVAALALSLLAAKGWDARFSRGAPRPPKLLPALVLLSLALAAALMLAGDAWNSWLAAAPADELFGPLDAAGARVDVTTALFTTALLGGVFYWLLIRARGGSAWAAPAALVLTAIDVALAAGWMTPAAPAELWSRPSYAAEQIAQLETARGDGGPYRVFRSGAHWYPPHWESTSSAERQREGLAWDRDVLLPKHHLSAGAELVESPGAMTLLDHDAFLRLSQQRRAELLAAVGARYFVLPPASGSAADNAPVRPRIVANRLALPRAWIVHDVVTLPPLSSRAPRAVRQRTRQVFLPDGELRDLRQTAVVETNDAAKESQLAALGDSAAKDISAATCRVERYEPQRVEIAAQLASPGLLVLSDTCDPGWTATVHSQNGASQRAPILRVNRFMRGVALPAGEQRVVFQFRPLGIYLGGAISVAAWLALAAWCVFLWRVSRNRHGRVN